MYCTVIGNKTCHVPNRLWGGANISRASKMRGNGQNYLQISATLPLRDDMLFFLIRYLNILLPFFLRSVNIPCQDIVKALVISIDFIHGFLLTGPWVRLNLSKVYFPLCAAWRSKPNTIMAWGLLLPCVCNNTGHYRPGNDLKVLAELTTM